MHASRESISVMTTFDDRERGYEARFAQEKDAEFRAVARRNRSLGVWAGELMGLEQAHLDDYARAVVKSEVDHPDDEDVLRKVFEDLKGSGVQVSEGEVRMKMAELMAFAREQIKTGA